MSTTATIPNTFNGTFTNQQSATGVPAGVPLAQTYGQVGYVPQTAGVMGQSVGQPIGWTWTPWGFQPVSSIGGVSAWGQTPQTVIGGTTPMTGLSGTPTIAGMSGLSPIGQGVGVQNFPVQGGQYLGQTFPGLPIGGTGVWPIGATPSFGWANPFQTSPFQANPFQASAGLGYGIGYGSTITPTGQIAPIGCLPTQGYFGVPTAGLTSGLTAAPVLAFNPITGTFVPTARLGQSGLVPGFGTGLYNTSVVGGISPISGAYASHLGGIVPTLNSAWSAAGPYTPSINPFFSPTAGLTGTPWLGTGLGFGGVNSSFGYGGVVNPFYGVGGIGQACCPTGLCTTGLSPLTSGYSTLGLSQFGVNPFGVNQFGVNPLGVSPFGVNQFGTGQFPTGQFGGTPWLGYNGLGGTFNSLTGFTPTFGHGQFPWNASFQPAFPGVDRLINSGCGVGLVREMI